MFPPQNIFDNRFRVGKCHFEWVPIPDLSTGVSGAMFKNVILDVQVGSETVLVLIDSTPFVRELHRRKPFELRLNAGFAETNVGPILYLLWWVPPIKHGRPFATYEHLLNPTSQDTLNGLIRLAKQTHLHVVLLGSSQELLDVYEFENIFGFENLIAPTESACRQHPEMDFTAAQKDFEQLYDLIELFNASV